MTRVLLFGASLVPVDNVGELPGILVELKLKLAILVDDQLRSWVENARALVLVRIVQVEFASGQVVGDGSGVTISFTESNQPVRGEAKNSLRHEPADSIR